MKFLWLIWCNLTVTLEREFFYCGVFTLSRAIHNSFKFVSSRCTMTDLLEHCSDTLLLS
jgi:hypothetical protein